jgi:hypothetical protein
MDDFLLSKGHTANRATHADVGAAPKKREEKPARD